MRFSEFIIEKINQRYQSLKSLDLFEGMKPLSSYNSDKLTAKMWIFPDGKVKSISGWHYQFIMNNSEKFAVKYGINVAHIPATPENEQPIRIAAIKAGFFRVNYEIRSGALTIEGLGSKFHKKIKDAIFMLVMDNMEQIGYFNINLFNDKVDGFVLQKSIPLFKYNTEEKFAALDGII